MSEERKGEGEERKRTEEERRVRRRGRRRGEVRMLSEGKIKLSPLKVCRSFHATAAIINMQ